MNCFSNDIDLLKFEPKLFTDLYFPSQVLTSGTAGALNGTAFTKAGENFSSKAVAAGNVIYLKSADGTLDGSFEIISVDSAAQLTISVLRADTDQAAIPPHAAADITYRIATFAPQANEAFNLIMRCFDLDPDGSVDIVNPDRLRRASVFMTLSTVFAALTGDPETSAEFWNKSLHYRKLFEQARSKIRLELDLDFDGLADISKLGNSIKLLRE